MERHHCPDGLPEIPIVMEYDENTGSAAAALSWSSTGQVKQAIPQTQLYPASASVQPKFTRSTDGTQMTITWAGTFNLYSAPSVDGPWTIVSGAASPYPITIDPGQLEVFYRLLGYSFRPRGQWSISSSSRA